MSEHKFGEKELSGLTQREFRRETFYCLISGT